MKNKKNLFILIFSVLILTTFTIFAFATNKVQNKTSKATSNTAITSCASVTEEEVIKALAYTYNDKELLEEINKKTISLLNGKSLNNFGSLEYSNYTQNQFGGIYVDPEKQILYICYTDGLLYNQIASLNKNNSETLKISDSKKIGLQVKIKKVENSYNRLQSLHALLSNLIKENETEFSDVRGWGINIIENKLRITLYQTETFEETKNKLCKIIDEDTIIFEYVDPQDNYKFMSGNSQTVTNESILGNGSSFTSVCGIVYNPSRNDNLLITCGHGYSSGQTVYQYLLNSSNQYIPYAIGTIIHTENTSSTDFSVIEFNSNSNYSDIPVNEMFGGTPAVGSRICINGFVSGEVYGNVLETTAEETIEGMYCSDMIRVSQVMQSGDSGGGAYTNTIDAGRTNVICAIMRAGSNRDSLLSKASSAITYAYNLP